MKPDNDTSNTRQPVANAAHAQYHAALAARKKHLPVAYFLLICAGVFGGHKWYLKNQGSARTYCYLAAIPIFTVLFYIYAYLIYCPTDPGAALFVPFTVALEFLPKLSVVCLCIILVCLVIDIFDMPAETSKCNLAIQEELAQEMQITTEQA